MALSQNIEINGIQLTNAYVKVENASVTKDSLLAKVVWRASSNSAPIKNEGFSSSYDLSGENPIKQAYLHLKTLPAFSGANDC